MLLGDGWLHRYYGLDLPDEISWTATGLSIMVLGKFGKMIVVDLGVVS